MNILVTGGAGYIGSHTVRELVRQGYAVTVFDNLSRGHREAVDPGAEFLQVDLLDPSALEKAFASYSFDAVIHFAAFAYVGESMNDPLLYYRNNVIGSFNLLKIVREYSIDKFIFSSTCSIYGNPGLDLLDESLPPDPVNPYAQTKLIIEQMLNDHGRAYGMRSISLRYFNAAGASTDGVIGESHEPEPHLIPLILHAVNDPEQAVRIFGNDYPTPDGTCIRDYIHVEDLADAHIRALQYLFDGGKSEVINIGTGKGNSVLEAIETVERVTGGKVSKTFVGRRAGDPPRLVADNKKAKKMLGWEARYNIDDIIRTAWHWFQNKRY